MDDLDKQWHLDKRVPITLVFLIFVQTSGAFWWASKLESTVTSLQQRVTENEIINRRQYDLMASDRNDSAITAKQLAKVEGLLQSIDRQVSTLTTYLINNAKTKDK